MRLISVLICIVSLYLFAPEQVLYASSAKDSCDPPPSLHEELSKKYPNMRPISLADLDEDDRKLFRKDHGIQCPGWVRVDFYGDGMPTWAVVLIAGENPNRKAELVVVRQGADGWVIRSLETTDGSPVVWREGPGKYEDVYGNKTIRAASPVIVFCGYNSWAVVYSWTGSRVTKVWLRD
jgi:hypothetical protein